MKMSMQLENIIKRRKNIKRSKKLVTYNSLRYVKLLDITTRNEPIYLNISTL